MTGEADGGEISKFLSCFRKKNIFVLSLTNFVWCSCHWLVVWLVAGHLLHLFVGEIERDIWGWLAVAGCEQKRNGHLSGCVWQEYKY